jgi:hypothetical protein
MGGACGALVDAPDARSGSAATRGDGLRRGTPPGSSALARQEGLSLTGLVSTGDVVGQRDSSLPVPGADTGVEAA